MTSVLVVDADDDVRASIGEILQGSGITVALASRGLEALALLRRVPVDVVLVDLRLPDFAEVDILRALRNELARIPVIVTGVESPGAAIEAGSRARPVGPRSPPSGAGSERSSTGWSRTLAAPSSGPASAWRG